MIGRFARLYSLAIDLVVRMVRWIEMHVGRIFHQAKVYNFFKILPSS